MKNLIIQNGGKFQFVSKSGVLTSAEFPRYLIKLAWDRGCDFEQEADGFGEGLGTCGGDWSGIRDSSEYAITRMLSKAMKFLKIDS